MPEATGHMERMLRITDPLSAPLTTSAIQALELPKGSQGLDAGRGVGLKEVKAQTFVREVQAPLSRQLRAALAALIDIRWTGAQSELDSETWGQYERLCSPDSPDFIADAPDYYGFFTETLFHGRVSA